jgi:hypothetical protein
VRGGLKNAEAVIVVEEERLNFVARPNAGRKKHEDRSFGDPRARDEAPAEPCESCKQFFAIPGQRPPPIKKAAVMWSDVAVCVFSFFGFSHAVG